MRPEAVLERAGLTVGGPPERLSGGDMGEVWRVGGVVVKSHPCPPGGLFPSEARGLRWLEEAGAPVPEVLWAGEEGLVIPWLPPGPPDWPALGRAVARLHRDRSGTYGCPEPLFLGRFPLPAGTAADGREVLVELRLRPLLRATRARLGAELVAGLEAWLDRAELPREGPSLVHGDLWSGNVHHGAAGPALIDPSTQRAERGYDLAMMELFGGFPSEFWRPYEEVWPIPEAVRRALPAYRLVFLLVHVQFFGAGYVPAVRAALSELQR